MKITTGNKLNKFWKLGVLPIKNALTGKQDKEKVLNSKEEIMANTSSEYAAGALAVKELNNDLSAITKTTKVIVPIGAKFGGGSGIVYIRNKICYMTLECTPSSNVVNGDIVASGLPIPISRDAYLSLQLANGYSYSASIDANGNLGIYYPTYVNAARIDTIISYIAN